MNARVNFLATGDSAAKVGSRVLVAKAAVVKKDGSDFVFVIKGNEARLRSVKLGEEASGFYHVLEGLSGGELTATTGAEMLRDGDSVKISSN